MKKIFVEEIKSISSSLSVGETVLLTGTVYTARDAAHKRIFELLDSGETLPFGIENSAIYFAGPTPTRPGTVCGSFGPTTSSRMDAFSPRLYDMGLAATIGKGDRNADVVEAIKRNGALYLAAIGGAGALCAKHITSNEEIAFKELGCESVKKLYFNEFPLIVAINGKGENIYDR